MCDHQVVGNTVPPTHKPLGNGFKKAALLPFHSSGGMVGRNGELQPNHSRTFPPSYPVLRRIYHLVVLIPQRLRVLKRCVKKIPAIRRLGIRKLSARTILENKPGDVLYDARPM